MIIDVNGDGNCFFRCMSLALHDSENEHKEIRERVVRKMREDKEFYRAYISTDFEKHTEGMSNSNGRDETWATEAELIAASECYNRDIYVYTKVGNKSDWCLYSKDGQCHHTREYIKILSTGSHYKLVRDEGRPCNCGEHILRGVTEIPTVSETPNSQSQQRRYLEHEEEIEQDISFHYEHENATDPPTPRNHNRSQEYIWNGMKDDELKQIVETMYSDTLHFLSYNMFMPSPGPSMDNMRREMTKLILEYVMDTPFKELSLEMLISMPKLLLQREHRKARGRENNKAFKRRIDAWLRGNFEDLLEEAHAIQERLEKRLNYKVERDIAKSFRRKMEIGHVRQASRLLQNESRQGIIPLNDDTLKQLREKHPEGVEASEETLLKGDKGKVHQVTFNCIDGEMVKRAAIETKGSAGPSGMDADTWRMLLTSRRNLEVTAELRNAVALLAKKMCVEECHHLEPITNSRLIPLKSQCNGVRPIGVGEVLGRIIGH